MGVLDIADRAWPVLRRLMAQHARIYRATNGVIGHRVPFAPLMLLLDHVGAKRARTTPLVYVEDGADVVIVASKGGHPRHLGLVPQPPGPPGHGGPDRASAARSTLAWSPRPSARVSGRGWLRSTTAAAAIRSAPSGRSRSWSSRREVDRGGVSGPVARRSVGRRGVPALVASASLPGD